MSLNKYVVNEDDIKINESKEKYCCICLNSSEEKDFIKIKCGHSFHSNCLKQWLISQGKVKKINPDDNLHLDGSCPICRNYFSYIFISENFDNSFNARVPYSIIALRLLWRLIKG